VSPKGSCVRSLVLGMVRTGGGRTFKRRTLVAVIRSLAALPLEGRNVVLLGSQSVPWREGCYKERGRSLPTVCLLVSPCDHSFIPLCHEILIRAGARQFGLSTSKTVS
jgi:hypothetical protein